MCLFPIKRLMALSNLSSCHGGQNLKTIVLFKNLAKKTQCKRWDLFESPKAIPQSIKGLTFEE